MKQLLTLTKVMMIEKKAIFLSILLGFIAAASSVGLLGAGGYLISKAALTPPLYTLTLTIILVRFFGLARAASRYAERYVSHKATFSILGRLRVYFYDKIEPLAPAILSKYRSGDLLSRIVADVDRLQYYFLRVIYPPFVMIVVFIATGVIIYTFSLWLALVLLLGLFVVGFIIPLLFTLWTEKNGAELRNKRSQLSVETTELMFGFTDLKTNNEMTRKHKQIRQLSNQLIEEQEKDGLIKAKGEAFSTFAAYSTSWFTLVLGVTFIVSGELDGVYLAMLVLITLTVFETATPMSAIPSHLDESKVASRRLFQLTSSVKNTDVQQEENKINFIDKKSTPVSIIFKDVSFAYPNVDRKAIKQLNFEVKQGEKVAIVGASGSGKSSILNLLLKFYKNYEGEIFFGDKPLSNFSEEEVRSFFAVVTQENHFFQDTIRANLLVGNPQATDEQLIQSLEAVSLGHLNLDQMLSEKGLSLSGGERQRLAIARMVLKDAPILLLDEPTTGLDSLTEADVLKSLLPQMDKKSVLFITHRLIGLEKMDCIIVLNKGEIIEQGTYTQLQSNKGYFNKLTQLEKEKI